ncbi:MAG: transporter substrate-binding domain-containing protein [Pseudomonadales bacterium]|nr:transporter substrate-binding domain-containing protein [Pseudomonadales bacterium]
MHSLFKLCAVCCLTVICQIVFAQPEIRILTTEEPPTNYTENGRLTGITTDVVMAIQQQIGSNTPIEVLPWARAYRIASSEPNIIIFTAGKTQTRVDLGFHFIGPVVTRSHILIGRSSDNLGIKVLDDVKTQNLEIGAMRGDWREKFFSDQGFKLQSATDHYVVLKMLAAGRIPLAISSDLEAPAVARKLNLPVHTFKPVYEFDHAASYILFSKGTSPKIVDQWQQAFLDLQTTDFFFRTAANWTNILGLQVQYNKIQGFFVSHQFESQKKVSTQQME